MAAWWTCPLCWDRMAESTDPRNVERDRDAHLATCHAGDSITPRLLIPSHWPVTGEPTTVRV